MSPELTDPWQNGPTEIIKYSISLLLTKNDSEKSRAFLNLDLGVEQLLKTYLKQKDEITERLGFHGIIRLTKDIAGERLRDIDLKEVVFYHNLRNKISHDGNGITVFDDHLLGYAKLAVDLLKTLLDVDLTEELESRLTEIKERKSYSPIDSIFKTLNDFSENEEALVLQRKVESGKHQNLVYHLTRTAFFTRIYTRLGDFQPKISANTSDSNPLLLKSANLVFCRYRSHRWTGLARLGTFTRNLAL